MLTFYTPGINLNVNYPKKNFIRLNRLQSIFNHNARQFTNYLDRTEFNLESNHILVRLLQTLAIDSSWSKEEVIAYAGAKSLSISSMFGITSITNRGSVIEEGCFKEGIRENWILSNNGYKYLGEDNLDWRDIYPLRLLTHAKINRSYKSLAQKNDAKLLEGDSHHVAVIAIDIEALALGWWVFMNDPNTGVAGITNYLLRGPLRALELMSNEYTVLNRLYNHFVKGDSLNPAYNNSSNVFATLNETKILEQYVDHLANIFDSRTPYSYQDVYSQFKYLYNENTGLTDTLSFTIKPLLAQNSWVSELANMKHLTLYLAIMNRREVRARDVNAMIDRNARMIANNFRRIRDVEMKDIYINHLDILVELNNLNFK